MWVIIGIIAVLVIRFIIDKNFSSRKHSTLLPNDPPGTIVKKERPAPADMTEPDKPVSFGYKGTWLAVKGNDIHQMATTVGIRDLQPCNWTTGIKKAYEDAVFVTPSIDGWTLLVGIGSFPDADSQEGVREIRQLLNDLSSRFDEAQYFGTHRGVGYAAWFRSVNGVIIRAYSIADGETFIVEGEPTAIEQSYHLINTLSEEAKDPGYFEREDLTFLNEEDVMSVAGAWSVNPSILQDRQDLGTSLGFIGSR